MQQCTFHGESSDSSYECSVRVSRWSITHGSSNVIVANPYQPSDYTRATFVASPASSFLSPLSSARYGFVRSNKSFAVYHIHVHWCCRGWTVQRRYSDFVGLHRCLRLVLEREVKLPSRHFLRQLSGVCLDAVFLERRRADLERYLHRVLDHPKVYECAALASFIGCPPTPDPALQRCLRELGARLTQIEDRLSRLEIPSAQQPPGESAAETNEVATKTKVNRHNDSVKSVSNNLIGGATRRIGTYESSEGSPRPLLNRRRFQSKLFQLPKLRSHEQLHHARTQRQNEDLDEVVSEIQSISIDGFSEECASCPQMNSVSLSTATPFQSVCDAVNGTTTRGKSIVQSASTCEFSVCSDVYVSSAYYNFAHAQFVNANLYGAWQPSFASSPSSSQDAHPIEQTSQTAAAAPPPSQDSPPIQDANFTIDAWITQHMLTCDDVRQLRGQCLRRVRDLVASTLGMDGITLLQYGPAAIGLDELDSMPLSLAIFASQRRLQQWSKRITAALWSEDNGNFVDKGQDIQCDDDGRSIRWTTCDGIYVHLRCNDALAIAEDACWDLIDRRTSRSHLLKRSFIVMNCVLRCIHRFDFSASLIFLLLNRVLDEQYDPVQNAKNALLFARDFAWHKLVLSLYGDIPLDAIHMNYASHRSLHEFIVTPHNIHLQALLPLTRTDKFDARLYVAKNTMNALHPLDASLNVAAISLLTSGDFDSCARQLERANAIEKKSRAIVDESVERVDSWRTELDGDWEMMLSNWRFVQPFDWPISTREEIVMMLTRIISQHGPLTIGNLGSQLHRVANNHHMRAFVKERFGGLKALLHEHPHVFFVGHEHPHNPIVRIVQQSPVASLQLLPPPLIKQ